MCIQQVEQLLVGILNEWTNNNEKLQMKIIINNFQIKKKLKTSNKH